ncbi:MAG: tetratricopeptide repeat protein [Spirochaetaceae bacterium]|nr:tetratricopeptide repeat protein [Spirochaetaceae bacterium]
MSKNFKKAEKKFKQGKYSDVIRYLEPEVFKHRENERFYYYLGISCLFLGDFGGANSYLRRALQIKPDSSQMLGLAVVHLKHGNPSEAIRIWLDILDKDPENKYARRSLDILRKSETLEKIPEDFLAKNINKFLPHFDNTKFYNLSRYAILTVSALIILTTLFFGSISLIRNIHSSRDPFPELTISRNLSDIVTSGDFLIELQPREIVTLFEQAKLHFINNRDNDARININTLLNSNASESVKDSARLLDSYLRSPDARHFRNTITYRMIAERPYLYHNCYVRWSGRIANIQVFEDSFSCDFLIGYHTGRIVEGIVNLTIDFPVVLDEHFSYEIIGRLKTDGPHLTVEVLSLRNF